MKTNLDYYRDMEANENVRFAARRLALVHGLADEFILKVDPDKDGVSVWESNSTEVRHFVKPLRDDTFMTWLSGCVARSALADPKGYQGSPVMVDGAQGHDITIPAAALQQAEEALSPRGEGQMDVINTDGNVVRVFQCTNGIVYESTRPLVPAELALKILIDGICPHYPSRIDQGLVESLTPDARKNLLHLVGILDFVELPGN